MQISAQTVFAVLVATRQGLQIEGLFGDVNRAGDAQDALLAEDAYDTIFSADEAPEWAGLEFRATFNDDDEAYHTSSGKLIWISEMPIQ